MVLGVVPESTRSTGTGQRLKLGAMAPARCLASARFAIRLLARHFTRRLSCAALAEALLAALADACCLLPLWPPEQKTPLTVPLLRSVFAASRASGLQRSPQLL